MVERERESEREKERERERDRERKVQREIQRTQNNPRVIISLMSGNTDGARGSNQERSLIICHPMQEFLFGFGRFR